MARKEVLLSKGVIANWDGGGTNYIVETPTGVLYAVFIQANTDVAFRKSLDGGRTWAAEVIVFAGTVTNLAIWYDRWSGIAAGLIHCAYSESATDDTLYRTINTESADALSTQTVIFAGASTAAGGHLSITRARGGNVYCKTCIDAAVEGVFSRLVNANVPNGAWAARTINEALAAADQMILMPGFAADDQDIMAFFWDSGSDEISRQVYDDSANSWAETSIATGMVDLSTASGFPNFAAAVDLTNSRNLLVAWSATDTSGADLRCWHVTESAITEVTNVVLNSTDDQAHCAIGIDTATEDWYVFYCGKSDGSETFNSLLNIYCKKSTDDGATWGAETAVTDTLREIHWLITCPRFTPPCLVISSMGNNNVVISVEDRAPRSSHQLGM